MNLSLILPRISLFERSATIITRSRILYTIAQGLLLGVSALLIDTPWAVSGAILFCFSLSFFLLRIGPLKWQEALLIGFFFHISAFYWLQDSLQVFLDLSTFTSYLLAFTLWLLCSTRFVLFVLIYNVFSNRQLLPFPLRLPLAWMSATIFLPEFIPWRLGNLFWWDLSFVQFADCVGTLGMSFIVLFCSELIVRGLLQKKVRCYFSSCF